MPCQRSGEIPITSESDIVEVRRRIREESNLLGFDATEVTRIVTSASELARNIYRYAKEGSLHWTGMEKTTPRGIELVFEDQGPGIPDVEQAMTPGFSTMRGLGLGLPGTKRLMDEMEIESEVGKGTRVVIRKWLRN